ncbi:hypothetical protein [Blastomonas sp.]|uniref:hypothetical protein n=1 Tax=Blastomonas sp. TaxID=1909299 RepID=UPI003593A45E
MYSPLSPILAATGRDGFDPGLVAQQVNGLHMVIGMVARVAGVKTPQSEPTLSDAAEMTTAIDSLSDQAVRALVARCDSLSAMLRAGLQALEHARSAGKRGRGAARQLYDDAQRDLARIVGGMSR